MDFCKRNSNFCKRARNRNDLEKCHATERSPTKPTAAQKRLIIIENSNKLLKGIRVSTTSSRWTFHSAEIEAVCGAEGCVRGGSNTNLKTLALKGSPTQLQTTACTSSLLHARHSKINGIPTRRRSGCPESGLSNDVTQPPAFSGPRRGKCLPRSHLFPAEDRAVPVQDQRDPAEDYRDWWRKPVLYSDRVSRRG
jgi:hypothetical protein